MKLYEKYKTLLNNSGINTPLRIAHFMAQIEHESNLKPIEENLNYSAQGLKKTFKKHFVFTKKDTKTKKEVLFDLSKSYERQPERIANRVYANRMGNGSESSGEGWKYRGRGFIQLTGKENYFHLANDTDLDVLKNPDLLLEEANAMISAIWFWNKNRLNELAEKDDVESITKRINGGYNGLTHRKELLNKYKKELL